MIGGSITGLDVEAQARQEERDALGPRRAQHSRRQRTTLREKLIKIGAKVVSGARYVVFQMAEIAVPRGLSRATWSGFGG